MHERLGSTAQENDRENRVTYKTFTMVCECVLDYIEIGTEFVFASFVIQTRKLKQIMREAK